MSSHPSRRSLFPLHHLFNFDVFFSILDIGISLQSLPNTIDATEGKRLIDNRVLKYEDFFMILSNFVM